MTCHVVEPGVVLAAAPSTAGAGSSAPHPVRRSLAFARTAGCAGCHEFRSLVAPGDDDDANFMQTTVREHAGSRAAAGIACAACHMPVVSGRRSHAFAESRDPAWLGDRLRVTAARAEGGRVRVTLVQTSPGHGFPTGDLFRRLEVGGEIRDERGEVVRRDVKHLARQFAIVPGWPGRKLVADDRVFDEPKVVDLALRPPPRVHESGTVFWWVTYQRVATVGTGTDPKDARIESEVRLHGGALPWDG